VNVPYRLQEKNGGEGNITTFKIIIFELVMGKEEVNMLPDIGHLFEQLS